MLDTGLPFAGTRNARNLTVKAQYEAFDIAGSAVAAQDIGLKPTYRDGREVTVPAIVSLPDGHGNVERFAVVREIRPGADGAVEQSTLSLRGLVQAANGKIKVTPKAKILPVSDADVQMPLEIPFADVSADSERTQPIALPPTVQMPTKRRFWQSKPNDGASFFAHEHPAGSLLTDGTNVLLIRGDASQPIRVRAEQATPLAARFRGRVAIDATDQRHISYRPPEVVAREREQEALRQQQRLQREAEQRREHMARIFAPPPTEAGQSGRFEVTSQSLELAGRMWNFVTPRLRAVVDPDHRLSSTHLIEQMRTDADLRLKVAGLFMDVLNDGRTRLPPQLVRNSTKRPAHGGPYHDLPSMISREYAARVALAKLDGTFLPAPVRIDPSRIDANGWPELDNHRSTADWLITGMKPIKFQQVFRP